MVVENLNIMTSLRGQSRSVLFGICTFWLFNDAADSVFSPSLKSVSGPHVMILWNFRKVVSRLLLVIVVFWSRATIQDFQEIFVKI